MSRPLRLEFSGALYHVTSRGNERKLTGLGKLTGSGLVSCSPLKTKKSAL